MKWMEQTGKDAKIYNNSSGWTHLTHMSLIIIIIIFNKP